MASKIIFSQDTIENIITDYQKTDMRYSDIMKKYNISSGTLNRVIKESNIELRGNKGGKGKAGRPPKHMSKASVNSVIDRTNSILESRKYKDAKVSLIVQPCRHCGNTQNIAGAKFCGACGKQLLTEKETVLAQAEKLADHFTGAAIGSRDSFVNDLAALCGLIKKLNIVE